MLYITVHSNFIYDVWGWRIWYMWLTSKFQCFRHNLIGFHGWSHLYHIWSERNAREHGEKICIEDQLMQGVVVDVWGRMSCCRTNKKRRSEQILGSLWRLRDASFAPVLDLPDDMSFSSWFCSISFFLVNKIYHSW